MLNLKRIITTTFTAIAAHVTPLAGSAELDLQVRDIATRLLEMSAGVAEFGSAVQSEEFACVAEDSAKIGGLSRTSTESEFSELPRVSDEQVGIVKTIWRPGIWLGGG